MSYKKATFYYSSGTGNTFHTAVWMADKAADSGVDSQVIPIEEARTKREVEASSGQLVGILTPTHGFTAPWHVIKSVIRLPWGKGANAFVSATRAGSKLGPLFFPGIAGSSCFLLGFLLWLRGYNVRGTASFDMPSNWISLHPGFRDKTAHAIGGRTRPLAENFITRILSGKRVWATINNLYEILWAVLLSWISLMYLLVGRFILAKAFFVNTHRCNSCGICADNCPVGAIRMIGRDKPKPYWRHNCQSCMRCMSYCPTKAIEASQQLIAFFSYICFLPFSFFVSRWIAGFIPGFRASAIPYLPLAIDLACIYAAIFLSYFLFYALSRVPWLNTVLVFTTGTHYYRRYYYPDTKLSELTGRAAIVTGNDPDSYTGS